MEQERQEENQKLTKKISPYKIIYPIIIGLAVVSYMLYKEFDPKAFDMITFTWNTVFWLFVAVLCMAIRDFGYIIRIKILSGGKLDSGHPGHIPLGIHLGRNSFRHRGNQPGDPFRA